MSFTFFVKKTLSFSLLLFISFSTSKAAVASKLCFTEAGTYFNIDPLLLRSIGIVESNLNTKAIGVNRNSVGTVVSRDYGIMQVNQIHISSLISKGVIQNEKELLDDPCLNIKVGSSILSKHFQKCGMNWHCLGTYNAGFAKSNQQRRLIYAKKIHVIYDQLNKLEAP
ncbi:TPA: lytic transglycosylase domain-containing protein [Yersinia enterocolitica]|nr:lytic transglycosylase domain-containing protein [Yersinia enterocolitica]HDL6985344.1 lytic transglycosylase domain-containing protein [Yersinia enterocolitica]HDL7067884.1 lytic transglycosylase domain-containing protein [Yersinia enterocolitica]HDL7072275.1 lytic transglycosylase domain-containing protein [Yersinia enterocolitica]